MEVKKKEKNPVTYRGRRILDNKLGRPGSKKDPHASMPKKKDKVEKE